VIDPGVGSARGVVAVRADDTWLVGPDNGLLSVAAERAAASAYWLVTWRPQSLSASFHGRDLFAPIAAKIAIGDFPAAGEPLTALQCRLGHSDLAEVIYIDHYGNAATGLRAEGLPRRTEIGAAGRRLRYARVFSDAAHGEVFWYENSLGLVEIAANASSAALALGLKIGDPVRVWRDGAT
jgi:S-adenosyl-L-methionine hydrolase (adenosine-forming)